MMHVAVGVLGRYSLNVLTGTAMAGSYNALQFHVWFMTRFYLHMIQ